MKIINIEDLPRKEQFTHFTGNVMYGITTKLDITNAYNFAKKKNISVYYCLGHTIYSAMKEIDEFNIRYVDGKLVLGNCDILSFCSLRKNETVMRFIGVKFCKDVVKFCKTATKLNEEQISLYGSTPCPLYKYACYFSCTPWFQFSCLTNPTTNDEYDFIPRLAWDKFEFKKDKVTTNFTIEVNHKLIDGYLIGLLLQKINEKLASLN